MVNNWKFWRVSPPALDDEYQSEVERLRAKAPIPALWLFGKTGSGKSSVVRYLTGAEAATIGTGFRPETRTSRRFDFPDSLEPLMTFLDTRGLGEAAYDPRQDIEQFATETQLMIVTVRITDHALESVLAPLRSIRKSAAGQTILLVLTRLHEATDSIDLSAGDDPFAAPEHRSENAPEIPHDLEVLIAEKTKQFSGLADAIIPIDLTQPEDGFADPNFGGPRLKQKILEYLPHAYRQALLSLHDSRGGHESYRQRRVRWQVLASSALAATAGTVPIPWVDIPAVLAIQAHLAVKIANIYEQELTAAHWAVLSSAAGSRIAARMAVREFLKFIPVVGMAAGAASSFAFTYALGMSWDWYFADVRGGHVPSPAKLKEVFSQQLKRGHELWKAE